MPFAYPKSPKRAATRAPVKSVPIFSITDSGRSLFGLAAAYERIRTNLETDLSDPALRELLDGGKIVVSTADHSGLTGAVKFVGWQVYLLKASGARRKARNTPHALPDG